MTNEKAIEVIRENCYEYNPFNIDRAIRVNTALDKAIKALEQTSALDKVREEIVHLHDWAFSREEILRIIDKYKAESEVNADADSD